MTGPDTPDELAGTDLAALRAALFGPLPELPAPDREAMFARTFDPAAPEPDGDLLPGWTGAAGPFEDGADVFGVPHADPYHPDTAPSTVDGGGDPDELPDPDNVPSPQGSADPHDLADPEDLDDLDDLDDDPDDGGGEHDHAGPGWPEHDPGAADLPAHPGGDDGGDHGGYSGHTGADFGHGGSDTEYPWD